MSSSATSATPNRIKIAAQFRARGLSWDQTAEGMSKITGLAEKGDTLASMRSAHKDEWDVAYQEAERGAIEEAAAEAQLYQQAMLRRGLAKDATPDDRRIGQAAAHSLLAYRSKLWHTQLHVTGSIAHFTLADFFNHLDNGKDKRLDAGRFSADADTN